MERTVVITGAGCFIGRHLVERLLREGDKIIAILRPDSKNTFEFKKRYPEVSCIYLEMDDYNEIANNIDFKCNIFISLAWGGTRGLERQNDEIQEKNYRANMDALNAAVKLGVDTFVTAGSQAEYGVQSGLVRETSTEKPITSYGKYKLRFYNDALKICVDEGIRIIEPRLFSLYGPGDFEGTLIMSTIKKMRGNKDCDFSDCKQKWNYLFVKDVADAIVYLIKNKQIDGGVYNFANKDTRCLKEFIYEMKNIIKSKSKLNFGILPHNDSGTNGINPCVDKLYGTGWRSKYTFSEGIMSIMSYMK